MTKDYSKAIGGKARAEKLSPSRRKEISQKANKTRLENQGIPKATHGSDEHPLCIGNIEIPCYVLDNGKRVLLQRGMASAIGVASSSGIAISATISNKTLSPFVKQELLTALEEPIKFKTTSGAIAHGYDARVLVDICDAILEARNCKKLLVSQEHLAKQCEILVRGFARVGLIALIDEATGYQEDRTKNALAQILEEFIAKELQPYVSTFPLNFYKELFRLRGLTFDPISMKRPQYFGYLTNNIIYKRLAPGILEELKKMVAISKQDNKSAKIFQHLTTNKGYPKLKEHLGSVVTLMKLSDTYDAFLELLDRIHPKQPNNIIENELELELLGTEGI